MTIAYILKIYIPAGITSKGHFNFHVQPANLSNDKDIKFGLL